MSEHKREYHVSRDEQTAEPRIETDDNHQRSDHFANINAKSKEFRQTDASKHLADPFERVRVAQLVYSVKKYQDSYGEAQDQFSKTILPDQVAHAFLLQIPHHFGQPVGSLRLPKHCTISYSE